MALNKYPPAATETGCYMQFLTRTRSSALYRGDYRTKSLRERFGSTVYGSCVSQPANRYATSELSAADIQRRAGKLAVQLRSPEKKVIYSILGQFSVLTAPARS